MHMFRNEISKTFNECLTEYRMHIAKKLLLSGNYRVYEISKMVGYANVKYFSQVFRREHGVTPLKYVQTAKSL
jgi:two-component system response regulator YesN